MLSSRPTTWRWISGLSAIVCLLPGGWLAYLSGYTLYAWLTAERISAIDAIWGGVGLIVFSTLTLASLLTLVGLFTRASRHWRLTARLFWLSLCGMPILIVMGWLFMREQRRIGGDWAGLGLMIGLVFGILLPAFFCIMGSVLLVSIRKLQQYPMAGGDQT